MNTKTVLKLSIFLVILLPLGYSRLAAEEVSGISTLSYVTKCISPVNECKGQGPVLHNPPTIEYQRLVEAYMDTEEDYTASLYYDVTSASASYFQGSATPLATATITGNPSATATYIPAESRTSPYPRIPAGIY